MTKIKLLYSEYRPGTILADSIWGRSNFVWRNSCGVVVVKVGPVCEIVSGEASVVAATAA